MAFAGISGNPNAGLGALGDSAGAIVDSVIGDLIDTITGDSKFKRLYLQDESDIKQYPDTQADRRLWHTIQTDRTQPDYFFMLKYKGAVIQVPFNINPKRETISEPHAATRTQTQGGGRIIQSEGGVTKDIVIQGTCGLYPAQHGRLRLPDSGIGSGFEALKMLQNVIRRYMFLRRFGDLTAGLELIYVSRRKQEAWVVDPVSFTIEDAVEHNFDPAYTITLETLYPYDGADTKGLVERLFDSIPGWRQADAIIQRLSEVVDQVNASVGQISAIVDGFGNTVMSRVMALANSFADLKAGRLPNIANFKRDSIKQTLQSLRETTAALESADAPDLAIKTARLERAITSTMLIDGAFDSTPDRKASTVTTRQNNQASSFQSVRGVSVSPDDAIGAGNVTARPDGSTMLGGNRTAPDALQGTETRLAQEAANQGALTQTRSTVGGASLDPNGKFQVTRFQSQDLDAFAVPPTTRQDEGQLNWDQSWNQALNNINPANADYRTVIVGINDSIQTLAFKVLGDHGRWVELVLLNDLKYPYLASAAYIEANALSNVAAYGQSILFPVPKQNPRSRVRVWRNENEVSVTLSPFERALGNDILIDEKTGDVVWEQNDLALVYGVNNIAQFARKAVTARKGIYRRAKSRGYSNMVGVSPAAGETVVKAETRSLFRDDERISSAEALKVDAEAGVSKVSIALFVRNKQDPVVVTVSSE